MKVRLKSPIVLAHGLLGFARLALRGIPLATYFRGVPSYLEKMGNRVILSQVPATASIAARAEALKSQIQLHAGTEPVHVIAHSMGGLDARHMISCLGMASQVLTLTTLGTPHHGTSFADQGLDMARRVGAYQWLTQSSLDHEAFEDLSTESCRAFNARTPDMEGVAYFSVAGHKQRNRMLYPLRFSHDVIAPREGPNDGLVSVRSARWGTFLGEWDADHVNLVGWTGPRERLAGFSVDIRRYYGQILVRLQECGF
jgi:triacylglycerol lipase